MAKKQPDTKLHAEISEHEIKVWGNHCAVWITPTTTDYFHLHYERTMPKAFKGDCMTERIDEGHSQLRSGFAVMDEEMLDCIGLAHHLYQNPASRLLAYGQRDIKYSVKRATNGE